MQPKFTTVFKEPARNLNAGMGLCYDCRMRYFVLLFLLFQGGLAARAPGIPASPGVYYRQNDNNWIGIPRASVSSTKAKGLDLFVETGGFTKLGTDIACPGARASTRISAPRPTFYVRESDGPKDAMLIRLTQKKTSRTFHTSSADATVENKEGFRKADIRKTIVTEYPEKIASITPEEDLKPGEYLLVLGAEDISFDFGIDPKR